MPFPRIPPNIGTPPLGADAGTGEGGGGGGYPTPSVTPTGCCILREDITIRVYFYGDKAERSYTGPSKPNKICVDVSANGVYDANLSCDQIDSPCDIDKTWSYYLTERIPPAPGQAGGTLGNTSTGDEIEELVESGVNWVVTFVVAKTKSCSPCVIQDFPPPSGVPMPECHCSYSKKFKTDGKKKLCIGTSVGCKNGAWERGLQKSKILDNLVKGVKTVTCKSTAKQINWDDGTLMYMECNPDGPPLTIPSSIASLIDQMAREAQGQVLWGGQGPVPISFLTDVAQRWNPKVEICP